jgi:hypothetical protein
LIVPENKLLFAVRVPANKLLFDCKVQANKLLFPKEFQQITIKKQSFYFAKDKKMEYPINQQHNKFALDNLMYEIPKKCVLQHSEN